MAQIDSAAWLDENEEFVYRNAEGAPITKEEYDEKFASTYDIPEGLKSGEITEDGRLYISDAKIKPREFAGNDRICEVYMEDTKGTVLGEEAFADCEYLEHIHLPETLKEIPDGLFRNDTNLDRLKLPQETERIGNGAFAGCDHLNFIHISANTKEIGNSAFAYCNELIDIGMMYADKLEVIGERAFAGCTGLLHDNQIVIPDSVTRIGREAFAEVTAGINISKETLNKINIDEAFEGYGSSLSRKDLIMNLKKAAVHQTPDLEGTGLSTDGTINVYGNEKYTHEAIEIDNFDEFKNFLAKADHDTLKMYEAEIKAAIRNDTNYYEGYKWGSYETDELFKCSIDRLAEAVKKCPSENKLLDTACDTARGYTRDGDMLYEDEEKTIFLKYKGNDYDVTIPEGVKEIGAEAFMFTNVKNVNLPDSLEEIGRMAFSSCGLLEKISLPEGLKIIGDAAFDLCSSLTGINIPDSVEELGKGAFKTYSEAFKNVSISDELLVKTYGRKDYTYGIEKVFDTDSEIGKAINKRAAELRAEREAAKERNAEAKHPARNKHQFEAEAALA